MHIHYLKWQVVIFLSSIVTLLCRATNNCCYLGDLYLKESIEERGRRRKSGIYNDQTKICTAEPHQDTVCRALLLSPYLIYNHQENVYPSTNSPPQKYVRTKCGLVFFYTHTHTLPNNKEASHSIQTHKADVFDNSLIIPSLLSGLAH